MTDAWTRAKQKADEHAQQSGVFIKLANDGDKVVGVFVGEPFAREVVWTGERYEEFDADNPSQKEGRKSLRVALNFFVPADNAMKVIEGGTNWFKDVLKVRDKYGLDRWIFEIERHGEAGNPKTTYSILPEEKIDDELRSRIAAVKVHDLEHINDATGEAEEPSAGKTSSQSGPVDPRVASELVPLLKALPRSALDEFLKRFGIERVRDLKAADEAAARAFIVNLSPAAPAEPVEVDPFA
jgi:hypothetical protein